MNSKDEYKQVYDNFISKILYQKIVSWNDQEIKLENGITLVFEEDQDCCAHAYGEWQFVNLDAIITDIQIDVRNQEDTNDRYYDYDMKTNHATITIFHNNNPIAKAECSANDGNGGYYYSILTLKIKETDDAICVVSA